VKRWEVSNADVTKKSLECESYIRARLPTAGSTQGKYHAMLCGARDVLKHHLRLTFFSTFVYI